MGEYKAKGCVIFDIDGTLANCEHRRHHVAGKKKDFHAFYEEMAGDTVNRYVQMLCNMYYFHEWHVALCTGRPERYREITSEWLTRHGIFYHELKMRPHDEECTPDYQVKQVMLDELRMDREVCVAVDDRKQVVDMWRRNGLLCLQVDEGDF